MTQNSCKNLFLYSCFDDVVVFFSYTLDNMQHLLDVLDTLCQISGLTINVEKRKIMGINEIQPRDYPIFTHNGEAIQVVQNFNYNGINVPSTNRWNVCNQCRLQAS